MSPHNQPRVELVQVTPAMAKELLKRNTNNRPPRARMVDDLAELMLCGEFVLTHQGIAISDNGDLLDGQHRLLAVVKSGQTVPMYISYGISSSVMPVIDTGLRRTAGDVLSINGHPNSTKLAASLKFLWMYRRGTWNNARKPNHSKLLTLLSEEPDLPDYMDYGKQLYSGMKIPPSAGITLTYLASRSAPQPVIQEWVRGLTSGAELKTNDPRLALRNLLLGRHTTKRRMPSRWLTGVYGKAWSAFLFNRPVGALRFTDAESLTDIENP